MRSFAVGLVCAGVALAGCSSVDRHYFREGVGANLYAEPAISISDDAESRATLQQQYVASICRQAGFAPENCGTDQFNPVVWTQFVQAGMNDIDQRCDAYLVWLDNVRRAQQPTLKELADAQTATTIIMRESGLSAAPIAIAAAAFGFAVNTYTNVTARLILEVDRSTVQTIVLSRQKKYREDLFGTARKDAKAVIASRPQAIFALRSYLRLCMPMTIETEINTTIATVERAGPDALKNGDGMISAKTVGTTRVITDISRDETYTGLRAQLRNNPELVSWVQTLFGPPKVALGVYLEEARYAPVRREISKCIALRSSGSANECKPNDLAKFR